MEKYDLIADWNMSFSYGIK